MNNFNKILIVNLMINVSSAVFFEMISAGFPIMIELLGTSVLRQEFGAISTLFPIFILPTITALGSIQTSFPISGTSAFATISFPAGICPVQCYNFYQFWFGHDYSTPMT